MKQPASPRHGPVLALAAAALLIAAAPVHAQDGSGAGAADNHLAGAGDLSVTPGFGPDEWHSARQPIELALSRPLEPATGRLAVFVGGIDLSHMFTLAGDRAVYRPGAVPLPSGETELTVYLVSMGEWAELGRFPLRVRTQAGFEQAEAVPRLDLGNDGQLVEVQVPEGDGFGRGTYQDVILNTGIQTHHDRDGWTARSQFNAVGVTNGDQALRSGELGDRAPAFDLADYLVEVTKGIASVSMGHVSFGSQPHLIDGFGSRGVGSTLRFGSRADLSLAALNGTSVVGWGNFLGLERREHRVIGSTLGLDLVPARAGGLRVEGTLMDGSVLPRSGFSDAGITDAETSRGLGFRVLASDGSQRVQLDAGYARSRFTNPGDPFLAEGAELVPVEPDTRDARYLNASIGILQGRRITASSRASLTASFRHEQVEPLFRSVASFAQADRQTNAIAVSGSLGPLAVQLSHARANDNLDAVASVLTTLTRGHAASLGLPLGAVMRAAEPAWWLPTVSYAYDRTHQFGAGLPENSGFDESHVPNQLSDSHALGLQWQRSRWGFSYRLSRSLQENRQPGREQAGFAAAVHNLTLALTPLDALSLGADLGREIATNREFEEASSTSRLGLNADWRPFSSTAVAGQYSWTRRLNDGSSSAANASEMRLELAQSLPWSIRGAQPPRAFARYARQDGSAWDFFGDAVRRSHWTVNTGVNVSFF